MSHTHLHHIAPLILPLRHSTSKRHRRRYNKSLRQQRSRRRPKPSQVTAPDIIAADDNDIPPLDLDPINLTSQQLNTAQINLLRKGPSFCPVPKDINWLKLQDDWDRFERRMRLKAFFHNKPSSRTHNGADANHVEFKPPSSSTWNPPKSRHIELELFLSEVKKGIFNPSHIHKAKDNLSKDERLALKQFRTESDNVLRIQDKGSRFVLLSKEEYTGKMSAQLDNPLHYRELSLDPSDDHFQLIQTWSAKWLSKGEISTEIANWICEVKANPGVAYGNVKTHKANNPLRLITSCCGTAIEHISAFTEHYLKPLAQSLPSFIKDTTHLLNKIEEVNRTLGPLPDDVLLVSWDVVSMFPNIDNQLGLTAVRQALDSRTNLKPSTDCIVEAVEICLLHNNSKFNDKNYLKTHGTAMHAAMRT